MQPLAARFGIHYSWVVAATTFLVMLVTAGAVGAPGVLIQPLQWEFGWSTAQISVAFAVRLVLFGLMGPFAAAFMNYFGVRKVVVFALTLIASGILASFAMQELWHLVLLWGVVVGLGTGMTAMVLAATVASRWFVHRRGLVVGLLTASTATGQLVFLPALAALSARWGWRTALEMVLAMLVLGIVAVLVLMRNFPADVGVAPYGSVDKVTPPPAPDSIRAMLLSPLAALRDASRGRMFWLLFLSFFVCGASTNGLVQTHFVALCGDYGIAAITAASMLAVIGAFDFIGTVASGWLSDRYDSRWLLFWYYGLRGLSLMYLPFTDFSPAQLAVFAVFYGLDWVATVPPTVKLAAATWGPRANLVFGWIFAGHQLGAASAAFGAGFTRTNYASYLPAFFVAGVLCVAAALAMVIRRRDASAPAGTVPA
ncbi:MAG: MFS transporter [Steroidobacteraceae bacterium]